MSNVVAEEASGVGVNLARLMILRARRAYLDKQKASAVGFNSDMHVHSENSGLSELHFVLTHIFRQLRKYSETEARARVLRKTDAVTARITDIENYRLLLLRVLHKRFDCTLSVVSNVDNFANVDKILPGPTLSTAEKESMSLFINRFRIATYEEPPILDFPACFFGMMPVPPPNRDDKSAFTMVSRWGHIYITHKDIFFHADAATIGNVMGFFSKLSPGSLEPIQLVLPITTISKCLCGAKATPLIAAALGKKKDAVMELRDAAQNTYVFGMPSGSPPKYADRVCDLLTILQSCVFSGHDLSSASAPAVTDEAVLVTKQDHGGKSDEVSSVNRFGCNAAPAILSSNVSDKTSTIVSSKNGENISNKEDGHILSSQKDAFSHVMKLASSALESALPGKTRSGKVGSVSDKSSYAAVTESLTNAVICDHGTVETVPDKKNYGGVSEAWFNAAPIGASMSIFTTAHISAGGCKGIAPTTTTINNPSEDATSSSGKKGSRPKPASLGKNIKVINYAPYRY